MSNVGLEAILADPSNDAPRLVWADREGGERGELVVIQCALAGHSLSREDRRRFKARETELLRLAGKWDGLGPGLEGTFVRGFIERVTVDVAYLAEVLPVAPLCSFVELRGTSPSVNAYVDPRPDAAWAALAARMAKVFAALPAGRILGLSASATVSETAGDWNDPSAIISFADDFARVVAQASPLSNLRELRIYGGALSPAAIPHLAKLSRLHRLCGNFKLTGADSVALLRAVPTLQKFAPWSSKLRGAELSTVLAAPEVTRLTELDLNSNDLEEEDVAQLAACTALAALERLGLGHAKSKTIEPITDAPQFGSLQELDLGGFRSLHGWALQRSSFGARLRVLEARNARVDARDVAALVAMPSLESVAVAAGPKLKAELEAVIPEVHA